MQCLIDGDILVYEVASAKQHIDEETGELVVESFDSVISLLEEKIKQIEAETWATEPSRIFLTLDKSLAKSINKMEKRVGATQTEYKENFRKEIAKTKVYKGQRKKEKPAHYHNIRQYLLTHYDAEVANGFEADDLICIELYKSHLNGKLDVICCSRDKDLRMVPGMHFGWACGNQLQYGPHRVTEEGVLHLGKTKLSGEGLSFFYAQMLMGDPVDNIQGIPKVGPLKAYKILTEDGESSFFHRVVNVYKNCFGDSWKEHYMENANLLWVVRELNEDGTPVMYQPPEALESFG